MGIGRTILETDSFVSNDLIAKLTNVFAESNEIQKDKMFADKHGLAQSEYKSEDYVRVAFKKEADMHDFTQAMRKEGVEDIVTTTYRYNGQFIAEMPRQATESASANLLIENYERTTGYKVNDAKEEYHDRGTESGERAEQSLARELLLKHLDGANETLAPIMDVVYWAETKAYQDDYSNGKNIYNHKANNDGEISMSAHVGRNSERAIVLNNDTVVINGQIVTDEKIRDNILKQHEERMVYTYNANNFKGTDDIDIVMRNSRREQSAMKAGTSQLNDTADTYGRLLAKEQNSGLTSIEKTQLNNAKSKLDEYKALSGFDFDVQLQYDASKSLYSYTTKNLSVTDFRNNNENVLSAIEKTGYPIRSRGGVFDVDKFKNISQSDFASLGITPQMADMIIDVNAHTHKLTPKQDLAERIKENVYRQEYTYESHKASDYKELAFCQWSYGSLSDITNALNEGNIALKVSNTEKMQSTFSRDEIDLFHKKLNDAGVSEIVLYEDTNFAIKALDIKYKEDIANIDKRIAEIQKDKKMLKRSTDPKAVSEYAKLEREERELSNKKVDIAREKKTVEDIINNISLNMTAKDKVMLNDSTKAILKDLSFSDTFKGLKIPVGDLKMENLIAINKAFLEKGAKLGYQFINLDGTFDIKLLKSLSAKELQKLGISSATRDMLVKINERGQWGHTGSTVGNVTSMVLTRLFYTSEDETIQQINQVRMSVKYTTDIVKTIRRSSNINVDDWLRARREKARANRANSNPNKAGKRKPKKKNNETGNPKSMKRGERYIKKQEKTLKKIERNKKSIRAKFSKAYQKVQEAIAKSFVGKIATALTNLIFVVIKLVGIAVGLLTLLIGGLLLIIVLIYFLISSLLSINPQAIINNLLAPDTYADTVAYQLYEVLSLHEEDFLDQVTDLDDMYENRATLKYGARYENFSTYIAREPRIIETDEGLRINPFSNHGVVTMDNHRSYMTRVDDYNGLTRYEIVTNPNAYTKITYEDIYMKSIESGHTSNIKDIICMVDVMYNMSMEDNSDDGMTNILGMSPAQINWNNFCEKVKNVFKWLGNVVSEFFNPDDPPPFVYVSTVSYKTIQNYATTLFECSHQQTINLNLNFYDVKRQLIITDGESEYNATESKLGSAYGICSDPEIEQFKLRYVSSANKVSPYLTNASGVGYNLDEGHFDVNIDMSMICGGASNAPCIYANWGSNQDTFNSIANMVNANEIYCWTRNSASQQETAIYQTFTSTTSYDDAIQQGHNWSDSYTPPSATFDLSTNMLIMDVLAYRKDESYVTDEYEVNYAVLDENGDLQYDEEGILVTDYYTVYKCTYTWGYEVESQYCRDCQGHDFKYCGGHIEVYSQGVVYSATNEQMSFVLADSSGTAPCVPSFLEDKDAMGYEELMGKIDSETLDKSDIYRAIQTGSVPVPTVSIQGSYSGSRGLNLWVEGGEWSTNDNGLQGERQYPQYTMDIFDVDTALEKGARIFPLNHFSKFDGWTAENMEVALSKMAMDWHDAYGFDIPWELSGYSNDSPLSTEDINTIVDALKARYGTSLTAEREECVRLVLSWVNRGHYVEGHESHCFLSDYCNSVYGIEVYNPDGTIHHTVQRQGNCTAGTDIDFANYVYKYFGKVDNRRSSFVVESNVVSGQYWSGVLPADIVVHKGVITQRGTYDNIASISKSGWQNAGYSSMAEYFGLMMSSWEAKTVAERYLKNQTVIYLGMVNFDIILSTGQVVKANTPILVDMQRMNVGGSITLHSRPSDSYDFLTSGGESVYYWADHLDGRVTYYSFD